MSGRNGGYSQNCTILLGERLLSVGTEPETRNWILSQDNSHFRNTSTQHQFNNILPSLSFSSKMLFPGGFRTHKRTRMHATDPALPNNYNNNNHDVTHGRPRLARCGDWRLGMQGARWTLLRACQLDCPPRSTASPACEGRGGGGCDFLEARRLIALAFFATANIRRRVGRTPGVEKVRVDYQQGVVLQLVVRRRLTALRRIGT